MKFITSGTNNRKSCFNNSNFVAGQCLSDKSGTVPELWDCPGTFGTVGKYVILPNYHYIVGAWI